MTTEAEQRVLNGGGQIGCVLCEEAARSLGITLPSPAVSVPPYRCHCPDWYEGEDCDHE